MRNKNYSAGMIIAIVIFVGVMFLFASCANLPGKETVSVPVVKPAGEISDNPENNGQTEQNQDAVSDVWAEPSEGPTVTPIILEAEKRGETGFVIIRTSVPEMTNFSSQRGASADTQVTDYSAYTQVNNPAVMKDEMQVINYNPVNGAVLLPGQAIHLDVTLKNTGTTTWQTNYKVVEISESPMSVQTTYNLPYAVAPGGTVMLSIYMSAPAMLGPYMASFQIQDAYNAVFGKFDYGLTVGDYSYVTEIPTLTPSITPTYYSPEGITATPDSLAWMCIDPERSKLQDCYSFCEEYSYKPEFQYCFYDGQRYTTPFPE